MVDIVDKKTRSRMMTSIKGKNTKPELVIRKALFAKGFRYKLHDKALPGRPDIVLPKYHAVIFVHGCYWHQHTDCKLAYSDRKYNKSWKKKFKDNVRRDQRQKEELIEQGWRVAVIWECATRKTNASDVVINELVKWIQSDCNIYESSYKEK